MSRAREAALLAVGIVLALSVGPLLADPHPDVNGGFSPQASFQLGDIDHVNLFNGNLVVTIPIGPTYPVAGGFSYKLTLVHNSNPWNFVDRLDSITNKTYQEASPSPCSNAGLGWRLSFGEINPPCTATDAPAQLYEDGSGTDHVFSPTLHPGEPSQADVLYTRDGSYLRLFVNSQTSEDLDFPDGSVHHFEHQAGDALHRLRLTRIQDAFGNHMDVQYGAGVWTVTDSPAGGGVTRTQRIYFRSDEPSYPQTIDHIDLSGPGGVPTTYRFSYTTATIARGCPNNDPYWMMPTTVPVPILTGVTLQDGSAYSMAPSDYSLPATPDAGSMCAIGSGDILGLQLPTLGRIEWTYQTYRFPETGTPWRTRTQGVATRTTKDQTGAVLGVWQYATRLTAKTPPPEDELVNSVTNPLHQRTDRYFSVSQQTAFTGWSACDYGQPFTWSQTLGGSNPLLLSSQTFQADGRTSFRRQYVIYERDPSEDTCHLATAPHNNRPSVERTVYDDDNQAYVETDFTDFDGVGHYRNAKTSGSFPVGAWRTHVVFYNPARGTYTVDATNNSGSGFTPIATDKPWLLNTSTYRKDVQNGVSSGLVDTCYDAQTGFLLRTRAHVQAGTKLDPTDVLMDYTKDSNGNVVAEKSYGGDVQGGVSTGTVLAADPCPLAPGPNAPEYEVDHTYTSFGALATTQWAGSPYESVDQTVDPATGLVTSSRDTAGLATTTTYDALWRPLVVQPAQGARTVFTYTVAQGSNYAAVDLERQGPGGGALARRGVQFDALGRLFRETEKLASGSTNVRETLYDGAGNKASVSELQVGNALEKTLFLNYDPAGRATVIHPADSSPSGSHDVKIAYLGARTVARTVMIGKTLANGVVTESPSTTTEVYDTQGRLSQVIEPSETNGANVTTTYTYDEGNHLMTVSTMGSGATQTRTFTYDRRGFLTSETHPEKSAAVTYPLHDSGGHVRQSIDGPHDLTYGYDPDGRLSLIRETGGGFLACNQLNGPKCVKIFSYAKQNQPGDWKLGKLYQSIRYNYPVLSGTQYQAFITETYKYGGIDGRVSQRDTLLTFALYGQQPVPSESFTESFGYDLLGDTTSINYPQCTFAACTQAGAAQPRTVIFGYTNGFLTSATNPMTGYTYGTISYWPNLMVDQVTHGNGIVDTQANDPNDLRRPQSITASLGMANLWQTGNYVYDGAGNVTQIGAARFLYDGVSRLTSGSLVLGPATTARRSARPTAMMPSGTSSRSAGRWPVPRRRARRRTG